MIFEPSTVTDASGSTEREGLYSAELRKKFGFREKNPIYVQYIGTQGGCGPQGCFC